VVEQRYRAVLEVIKDGRPEVEVASQVGVSRQTVHGWLARASDSLLAQRVTARHVPS
jgi:transposase-like protein